MISPSSKTSRDFHRDAFTHVRINPPGWKLEGRGIFFMGSCFADYLFTEYEAAGLNASAAPFGNIYNPESLAEAAGMLCHDAEAVKPGDCISRGTAVGRYRHFMFHSLIHAETAEALADGLNRGIADARKRIEEAEAAVLTLGTSLVYRLKSGETVSNCHRLPASEFDRVQLNVSEAAAALDKTLKRLRRINPELKIILTLSPVRHLRDNAAENSLSKAVLRSAVGEIFAAEGENGGTWYFPSYEIMLDELRDYRWYADDLCHPSEKAVSYIISRFIESAYSRDFIDFIGELSGILRDLKHRPLNPGSEDYLSFRTAAEIRKKELIDKHPEFFAPASPETQQKKD